MFQHGCDCGQLAWHFGAPEFVACLLEFEKAGGAVSGVGQRSSPSGTEGEPDHGVVCCAGRAEPLLRGA